MTQFSPSVTSRDVSRWRGLVRVAGKVLADPHRTPLGDLAAAAWSARRAVALGHVHRDNPCFLLVRLAQAWSTGRLAEPAMAPLVMSTLAGQVRALIEAAQAPPPPPRPFRADIDG